MTWPTGRERIQELLGAGELERVAADNDAARSLLEVAGRHVRSARLLLNDGDLIGAYQVAYDGLRKSAAALLEAQGLRATSRGGHVAVQDAVIAQFGNATSTFKAFSRIRRARNQFEYPSESNAGPVDEDVEDAITVASTVHASASEVVERGVLDAW